MFGNVRPAGYELATDGGKFQPLLINAEYLEGAPKLSVALDGKIIFNEILEKGHYEFEAPMPAVTSPVQSKYTISENGKVIDEGVVARSKQKLQTPGRLCGYTFRHGPFPLDDCAGPLDAL